MLIILSNQKKIKYIISNVTYTYYTNDRDYNSKMFNEKLGRYSYLEDLF